MRVAGARHVHHAVAYTAPVVCCGITAKGAVYQGGIARFRVEHSPPIAMRIDCLDSGVAAKHAVGHSRAAVPIVHPAPHIRRVITDDAVLNGWTAIRAEDSPAAVALVPIINVTSVAVNDGKAVQHRIRPLATDEYEAAIPAPVGIDDTVFRAVFASYGDGPAFEVNIPVARSRICAVRYPDGSSVPGNVDCLLYGRIVQGDVDVPRAAVGGECVTNATIVVHTCVSQNVGGFHDEEVIRLGFHPR